MLNLDTRTMTERLYYTDSYLQTFEATVVDRADDGRRIYLDRTAFYPTSGGQPFDTGRLDGAPVVEVIDEGERIAHLLSTPLAGNRVTGSIDWRRRFDHMQQHTGQHVLSAILAELFGFATTSVHFGGAMATLDLDTGSLTPEQVVEAELQANRIVAENRPVAVSFERAETAAGLRKPSEREGILRIVSIRDLDRSACGGTHVRATGEIGAIIIRGVERVRQGARLEFCCGERAIHRARREHELLSRAALLVSATPEELPALLEGQRRQLKDASAAVRALEQELAGYRARELYQAAVPDDSGVRRIAVQNAGESVERLRPLAQAVAALSGAVFVGTSLEPPAVLLATSEDSGVDAGRTLKEVLQRFGGRGGGNARLAQGTVGDPGALDAVAKALSSRA
jgi:alanyl-tRNA synthetase